MSKIKYIYYRSNKYERIPSQPDRYTAIGQFRKEMPAIIRDILARKSSPDNTEKIEYRGIYINDILSSLAVIIPKQDTTENNFDDAFNLLLPIDTSSFNNNISYVTDVDPDANTYPTVKDLNNALARYMTRDDINRIFVKQNDLNHQIEAYVLDNFNAKLPELNDTYALKSVVDALYSKDQIDRIFATKQDLANASISGNSGVAINDTTPQSTTTYSSEKIEEKLTTISSSIPSINDNANGANTTFSSNKIDSTYAKKSDLNSKLDISTYNQDKANFATNASVTQAIQNIQHPSQIDDTRLANDKAYSSSKVDATYAKKTELNSKLNVDDFNTKFDTAYTTKQADLEATYAKKTDLNAKLNSVTYNSEKVNFATNTSVDQKISELINDNNGSENDKVYSKAKIDEKFRQASTSGGFTSSMVINDANDTDEADKTYSKTKINQKIAAIQPGISQTNADNRYIQSAGKQLPDGDMNSHTFWVGLPSGIYNTQANRGSYTNKLNNSDWLTFIVSGDNDNKLVQASENGGQRVWFSSVNRTAKTPWKEIAYSDSISSQSSADVSLLNASLGNKQQVFTYRKSLGVAELDEVTQTPAYRIPAMVVTSDGTIIVASDYRNSARDQVKIKIAVAISKTGGESWTYHMAVNNLDNNFGTTGNKDSLSRVMDSTLLFNPRNEDVLLLAGAWKAGGSNWTQPNASNGNHKAVLAKATKAGGYTNWTQTNIEPQGKPSNCVGWLGGVGTGISLSDGTLIFPIQWTTGNRDVKGGFIYSLDNGNTWVWGGTGDLNNYSENNIIEYPINSGVLLNHARYDSHSYRVGKRLPNITAQDWVSTPQSPFQDLIPKGGSGCQGSTIHFVTRAGKPLVLATYPQNRMGGYNRDRITLYAIGMEDRQLVPILNLNYKGGKQEGGIPYGGYSCLSYVDGSDGEKLMVAYEDDLGISVQDLTPLIPYLNQLDLNTLKPLAEPLTKVTFPTSGLTGNATINTQYGPYNLVSNDNNKISIDTGNAGMIDVNIDTSGNNNARIEYKIQELLNNNTISRTKFNTKKYTISLEYIRKNPPSNGDNYFPVFNFSRNPNSTSQSDNLVGLTFTKPSGGNIKLNPTLDGTYNQEVSISESKLPLNTKVHIAVVVDDRTLIVYVNGEELFKNKYNSSRPLSDTHTMFLGQWAKKDKKHHYGIGNFVVYQGAMTQEEVISLAQSSGVRNIANTVVDPYASLVKQLQILPAGDLNTVAYWKSLANGNYYHRPTQFGGNRLQNIPHNLGDWFEVLMFGEGDNRSWFLTKDGDTVESYLGKISGNNIFWLPLDHTGYSILPNGDTLDRNFWKNLSQGTYFMTSEGNRRHENRPINAGSYWYLVRVTKKSTDFVVDATDMATGRRFYLSGNANEIRNNRWDEIHTISSLEQHFYSKTNVDSTVSTINQNIANLTTRVDRLASSNSKRKLMNITGSEIPLKDSINFVCTSGANGISFNLNGFTDDDVSQTGIIEVTDKQAGRLVSDNPKILYLDPESADNKTGTVFLAYYVRSQVDGVASILLKNI